MVTNAFELKAQHGAIRTAARHLRDVAVVQRGYRATACGLVRDLDELIAAHGAFEKRFDCPDLNAETVPLLRLRAAWTSYRTTWTAARIASDWSGFAAASQDLMPQMLERLDFEDACLDQTARRQE